MDHRDRARDARKWYDSLDTQKMLATVVYSVENEETGEYDDLEIEIPVKYEVCGTCTGRGDHVNPSIDAHGITPEEFAEDPDFEEEYFRGDYDVTCYGCGGLRVVPEPDESRLTEEMKKALEYQSDLAADDAADAYTRRMESGGYG